MNTSHPVPSYVIPWLTLADPVTIIRKFAAMRERSNIYILYMPLSGYCDLEFVRLQIFGYSTSAVNNNNKTYYWYGFRFSEHDHC